MPGASISLTGGGSNVKLIGTATITDFGSIILDRTFYIGDDLRDIEASYRSKTRCMYIGKEKLSMKLKKKYINTLI